MEFLNYVKSTWKSVWEWIKSAIQKVWAHFKAFLVKVADYAKTVMHTLRELIRKVVESTLISISIFVDWITSGFKKLFLVFTRKNDGFKPIIEKAKEEGKIGTIDVNAKELFGIDTNYDFHIVQMDKEHNTETTECSDFGCDGENTAKEGSGSDM